jgi:hypothetical protein
LLGLEEWPSRRRPDAIERGSETVRVAFPVDPMTGRPSSGTVELRLVAPEFDVAGAASKTVEVPPDSYSRRIVFLLTPRQPGLCRIQLEVYGPGGLYLGAVALETEIGTAAVTAPLEAAGLRLDILAGQPVVVLAASAGSGGPHAVTPSPCTSAALPRPPATSAPPPAPAAVRPAAAVGAAAGGVRGVAALLRALAPMAAGALAVAVGTLWLSRPYWAPPLLSPKPAQPEVAAAPAALPAAAAGTQRPARSFEAGPTLVMPPTPLAMGFDSGGRAASPTPAFTGELRFEVIPAIVRPGDSFVVRIHLLNEGRRTLLVRSIVATTGDLVQRVPAVLRTIDGEVPAQQSRVLAEYSGEWRDVSMWVLEAVVKSERGGTITAKLHAR